MPDLKQAATLGEIIGAGIDAAVEYAAKIISRSPKGSTTSETPAVEVEAAGSSAILATGEVGVANRAAAADEALTAPGGTSPSLGNNTPQPPSGGASAGHSQPSSGGGNSAAGNARTPLEIAEDNFKRATAQRGLFNPFSEARYRQARFNRDIEQAKAEHPNQTFDAVSAVKQNYRAWRASDGLYNLPQHLLFAPLRFANRIPRGYKYGVPAILTGLAIVAPGDAPSPQVPSNAPVTGTPSAGVLSFVSRTINQIGNSASNLGGNVVPAVTGVAKSAVGEAISKGDALMQRATDGRAIEKLSSERVKELLEQARKQRGTGAPAAP